MPHTLWFTKKISSTFKYTYIYTLTTLTGSQTHMHIYFLNLLIINKHGTAIRPKSKYIQNHSNYLPLLIYLLPSFYFYFTFLSPFFPSLFPVPCPLPPFPLSLSLSTVIHSWNPLSHLNINALVLKGCLMMVGKIWIRCVWWHMVRRARGGLRAHQVSKLRYLLLKGKK